MPAFNNGLKTEYRRLWDSMRVTRSAQVNAAAQRILAVKDRYTSVSEETGVPWFVIGVLHIRESSLNFKAHLHNGDPLTARTRQVPSGRPKTGKPPFTWVESAVDALMMPPHSLHQVDDWTIERICYEAEKYNGFGPRNRGINSGYLWAGSNHYVRGKYVADGKWSASTVDQQLGCMPIIKRLAELDEEVAAAIDGRPGHRPAPLPPPPDIEPVEPAPEPPARLPWWKKLLNRWKEIGAVVGLGGVGGTFWEKLAEAFTNPLTLGIIAALIVFLVVFYEWRKRRRRT